MRHFAFLRAINVGGHVVKMERLRGLFESFGVSNVETFIASGNVVFESRSRGGRALEAKLEKHLKSSLGYDVATFLRSLDELRAIATAAPFPPADAAAGTVHVAFAAEDVAAAPRGRVSGLDTEHDEFRVIGREIYWLRRSRDSVFTGAMLEKAIGVPATMRNMNTVNRIVAKYGA